MADCCSELKSEITRLRQEIAALDGRYMPLSERPKIYAAIGVASATAVAASTLASSAAAAAGAAASIASAALAGFRFVLGQLSAYVKRNQIRALENRVSAVEGGLNVLTRLANTLSNRIKRNASAIEILQKAIARLSSLIRAIESQIGSLNRKMADHAARIKILENAIHFIEKKLGKALRDILRLFTELKIAQALLATLNIAVAAATKALAALVAQVASIARSLAGLLGQIRRALDLAERAIKAVERFSNELRYLRSLIDRLRRRVDAGGQRGPRGPQGIQGPQGPRGLPGRDGQKGDDMNANDRALLRRILALISQDIYLDRSNQQMLSQLMRSNGQGELDLAPCNAEDPLLLPYSGQGLAGIYAALNAISQSLNVIRLDTKCGSDSNAALPMFWELKSNEIPQLVVVWRKVAGGESAWSMSVPHPKDSIDKDYPFSFPTYRKGGNLARVKLTDNSQIIVNVFSEIEAEKIIGYLLSLVNPIYLPEDGAKIIYSKNVAARVEANVKAQYIKKFLGHKNTTPQWGIHLDSG